MTSFGFIAPRQTIFGRGCRAETVGQITALGGRVLLVRGRSVAWVEELGTNLRNGGLAVLEVFSGGEPTLDQLRDALAHARQFRPDCVLAVGGGAAIDLRKAVAALLPSDRDPVVYLEVIGEGRPIEPDPLPIIAMPTTSGTGAEATRNAVITVPDRAIKVSLRDDRMVPDIAIVDPELTDGAPAHLTLATGLDAITQLIESYLSRRANPVTDAICQGAIPGAIAALARLMVTEDTEARDTLSRASYLSGIALASAGLGIVHGLAAVIGGLGGAHGAICGRLLPAALQMNEEVALRLGKDTHRFTQVASWLEWGLGTSKGSGSTALRGFIDHFGLESLESLGCPVERHREIAFEALKASSTRSNPVTLEIEDVVNLLAMS